ncbi:Eco57I restriction-modification methylase domain-containing protein [Qipengyuania sp. Mu-71]|jgi:hypothetical protein|uniref:Eco57I restriction-modification methylase domain-containing protein n=1 Tax=Qipengyuania sp. Mu-71 TaxID=3121477 RepID=UPI002FE48C73
MRINRDAALKSLESGDFRRLFIEELGWDHARQTLQIPFEGTTIAVETVAEKRSFKVFMVKVPNDAGQLSMAQRRHVRDKLLPLARENIVIFLSSDERGQIWQWTRRSVDKPAALREHAFSIGQTGEGLLQRLDHLIVDLEDEDGLTIIDVADRVQRAFDVERTTRAFYERFKTEHDAFLERIEGVDTEDDRAWYASVMLNRLMFVYFIQQRGFLDGDRNYLRNKLRQVQEKHGPDEFQSFYRAFLLRLFFDGLGGRESERSPELAELIGRVPYLNGGMFVEHFLEATYDIDIPDAAFTAVLDFFDEFDWHLDDRPVSTDNEINPDVLGYIFERYINNKQMGAYYTKEDVTEYISRTTVVPRILDLVAARTPHAFDSDGPIWSRLRDNPDDYIFPSMKVGAGEGLPDGVDQASVEGSAEAPDGRSLPRETWRGVIDRTTRYESLKELLSSGGIDQVDDLVTHNLDIRQFAQDAIERSDDPTVIDAFFKALNSLSVLDPTCGSGAFLFAALNVLEPIYEATVDRMRAFLDEAGRSGWQWNADIRTRFEETLAEVDSHSDQRYFIFRSIVVNNLFGVDIMEEAVEICKLRLFLKLASQIDDVDMIEPLPDIDFNIRCGNALVGYTDHPGASNRGLDLANTQDELERQAIMLSDLYEQYRDNQFGDRQLAATLKRLIVEMQEELDEMLNVSLGERYGAKTESKLQQWKNAHTPFHWWAAFYEQLDGGGFDVIVGNPPYISSAKVRKEYTVHDIETERAADIYAWVMERSANLLADGGRSGMIVPLSLTFSSRFGALRDVLSRDYAANWYSSFGRIPSALFAYDVRVRNTIHIGRRPMAGERERLQYTGRLHRWFEQERPHLFETLAFTPFQRQLWGGMVPKVHTSKLVNFIEHQSAAMVPTIEAHLRRGGRHQLHFKKSAYNWLNFCEDLPPCYDANGAEIAHTKFGTVSFADEGDRDLAFLLLNGKWEFAYWYMIGDDFDVTQGSFEGLPAPFARLHGEKRARLLSLVGDLKEAMTVATQFKLNAGKRVGNYNLAKCRHVTDVSDAMFAEAFGWEDVWPEVQLLYSQAVKTTYTDDEEGD